MKKALHFVLLRISILTVLIFLSCRNNNEVISTNDNAPKNKIAQLGIQYEMVYEYKYRFGDPDEQSETLKSIIEYNKRGLVVMDSNSYGKILYLYKDDKEIERKILDTLGRIESIIKNYKYENGLNIEKMIFAADGTFKEKLIYEYDKNKNNTNIITYDNNNKIVEKYKMTYDSLNNLILQEYYDQNGKISSLRKFVKLEGNKEEVSSYRDPENSSEKDSYIVLYNDKHQVTERIFFYEYGILEEKGIWEYKTQFKYDNNDLLIEEIEFDKNGMPEKLLKTKRIKFKD